MSKVIKFIAVILIIWGISLPEIYAQNVVPSERVQDKVNVRAEPNTQSDIIGTLKIGESARFIDSVPYWYKIELSENRDGYVSKVWTKLEDQTAACDSLRKTDLIIGSWNIKWLGKGDVGEHDYNEMAKIISKMDVIAIQELSEPNYSKELDSIKAHLATAGYKYDYAASDLTGYENNPDTTKNNYLERYGFMWDKDRIILLHSTNPLTFADTPAINNPNCRQVPVYADFKVKDGNGFDFRIMTIHTVYNKKISEVRKSEMEFVNNWLIDQSDNPNNTEKNIIVEGDFNANPTGQHHYFKDIIEGTTAYRILFEESLSIGEKSIRTTVQQKDNPGPDYFLLPVYDQVLVSNQTSYALPHNPMTKAGEDLGVIEFDQEPKWKNLHDWHEVINEVSDHRPVWFRLDYDAEDKD